MLDPLLTLLAAKAKAVGLVAGTAMVTAALAGGGAVAMTAVSHDGTVHDEVSVEQEVPDDSPTTLEDTSDTPTVTIEDPVLEEVEEVKVEVEDSDVPRPLPADFVCDDSKNHGQNVSAYARSLEKGPGRGEKVSAVAQSDCGKKAGDEQEPAEQELSVQAEEIEVDEPKPAKAEKKAKQAEKKAEQAEKKAGNRGSGKPAHAGGGKGGNGKGGGK